MAHQNRELLSRLLPDGEGRGAEAALPPRTAVLKGRSNRLSELADGQSVARMHEIVDPARCRIWEGHNRDYGELNEEACADLIESFEAQGRQEVPAIVRRLRGDADHDFEVICGARRHWTSSWMRSHGHPAFGFLVEPRELSDEEAFRVADLENRSRKDLSDIERARDYARAVDRYYDGDQRRMAQRLKVSDAWLSRFLELARLPTPIIEAFGSPRLIGISHAGQIAPHLRSEAVRERMLAAAEQLGVEQRTRKERGEELLPSKAVVDRLLSTGSRRKPPSSGGSDHVVRTVGGVVLAKGRRAGRGGSMTISLPNATRPSRDELLRACGEIFDMLITTRDG